MAQQKALGTYIVCLWIRHKGQTFHQRGLMVLARERELQTSRIRVAHLCQGHFPKVHDGGGLLGVEGIDTSVSCRAGYDGGWW
jgi:hypothetical protein